MTDECYVKGCPNSPCYLVEWYSLNQHGENPYVAYERPVCNEFAHLVEASIHEDYGGVPDGIVDYATLEQEHPQLLEKVIDVLMNKKK